VVVLTWPDAAGNGWPNVVSYNLYRKIDTNAPWPLAPVNVKPIVPVTDLAKLRTLFGPDDLCNVIPKALAMPNPGDTGLPLPPTVQPIAQDPCPAAGYLSTVARGTEQWGRLQGLARLKWRIALAIGQGYTDTTVTVGQTYYYQLRGLDANGNEQVLMKTFVAVKVGAPALIPPPPDVTAAAGDSRVLVTWGNGPSASPPAAGYYVYRSEAGGPFQLINESGLTTRIYADVQGHTNAWPTNGLMDIQRWDSAGLPTAHVEAGIAVGGPRNSFSYSYKVCAMDLLGTPSSQFSPETPPATPRDLTPPQAPGGLTVTPDDIQGTMALRWSVVGYDINGHPEWTYGAVIPNSPVLLPPQSGVTKYRVFRCADGNDPSNRVVQVAELPGPSIAGANAVGSLTWDDDVSSMRPAYGEGSFWYRVECEDAAGNVSQRSGAVRGQLRDIFPPAPPMNLSTSSDESSITITWALNTEPDMDGYLIFRSICHAVFNPDTNHTTLDGSLTSPAAWIQIGYLSQSDARQLGQGMWVDRTVPANSPLCYSYVIKAQDRSQNKSGDWPIGLPPVHDPSICQRLRDATPPPPAVITKLEAADSAIKVSWTAAPVQDIRAYYVYRSDASNGTYNFVGGLTVDRDAYGNAQPGQVLTAELPKPSTTGCDMIFPSIIRELGSGTYTDTSVQPKTIYWYKVVGIDQSGNRSELSNAVPVSTFTFATTPLAAPDVTAVPSASPCQVSLTWSPPFDAQQHSGFMVLRYTAANPLRRQIGGLVSGGSQYTDTQVQRGVTYWYQVVALDTRGLPSTSSQAVQVVVP
jgi:fibronectin type 3 domain-containing protein